MQLKDLKTRVNQSMPDSDDELQAADKVNKVTNEPAESAPCGGHV